MGIPYTLNAGSEHQKQQRSPENVSQPAALVGLPFVADIDWIQPSVSMADRDFETSNAWEEEQRHLREF